MDNKIDMNDIYTELDGLVSVMEIILEGLDDDLSVTRREKDPTNMVAYKIHAAERVESLFLPALNLICSTLCVLFRHVEEAVI